MWPIFALTAFFFVTFAHMLQPLRLGNNAAVFHQHVQLGPFGGGMQY